MRRVAVLALLIGVPATASASGGDVASAGPLGWAAKAAAKAGKAGKAGKAAGAATKAGGAATLATGAKAIVAGGTAYALARAGRVFGRMPAELADGAMFVSRSVDGGFHGVRAGARQADDFTSLSGLPAQRVVMDPAVALDARAMEDLADLDLHIVDGAGRPHRVRKTEDGEHWLVDVKDKTQDLVEFAIDAVAEGFEDHDAKPPWLVPMIECGEDAMNAVDWQTAPLDSFDPTGAERWLGSTTPQRVLVVASKDTDVDAVLRAGASHRHRMVVTQFDDPCATGLGAIYGRVESSIHLSMPLRAGLQLDEFQVLSGDPLTVVADVRGHPSGDGLFRIGYSFPPEAGEVLDEGRPVQVEWWAMIVGQIIIALMLWYIPPFRWLVRPAILWVIRRIRRASHESE